MGFKNIKRYWFDKLLAPRVVMIDTPGIICDIAAKKYGKGENKKRMIWHFEDIFVNIQLETIKKLGIKKTKRFYYIFGKKQTFRYMLLSNAKRPPSFLVPLIINYILSKIVSGGASVAKRVNYNAKNKILTIRGESNIFCRKSHIPDYLVGCISAGISFLVGQNIEAKSDCGKCPKQCKIIANPSFNKIYIPNIKKLKPSLEYNKFNFLKISPIPRDFQSFSDFMKFKKIWIDNEGKFCFKGKTIVPIEIGSFDLLAKYYEETENEDIFKKAVMGGAEKISKEIFNENLSKKDNLKLLLSILTSLGWGLSSYQMNNKNIIFRFFNFPFSKYKPIYLVHLINGHLNYIFKKRFKVKDINRAYYPCSLSIAYSSN